MARKGAAFLNIISAFNSQGLKDTEKGFNSLGSRVAKFGKMAAAAMAAAAAAVAAYAVKLAVDGVKAAIEDEKAQAKLATTLQNVTGATNKQIAAVEESILKMSLATGVADDKLRPAFENLVRATGDISEAQKQLSLAMDISAGTGKSLESVSLALAKAQTGNISALTRLGIPLDAAAVKSKDLNAIFSQLTDTFGGQAAVQADTFAGKMARLQVAFDEAKETVGAYILDAITPLVEALVDKIIPALSEFAENLGKKLKPVFEALAPLFKQVIGYFQNMGNQAGGASGIFSTLGDTVRWLWNYFKDFIPVLQDWYKTIAENVVPALMDLWNTFVNDGLPAIKRFLEFIKPILIKIYEQIKATLIPVLTTVINVVKEVIRFISGLIDFIVGVFTGDWSRAWDGVKKIFSSVWNAIVEILRGIGQIIINQGRLAFQGLIDAIKGKWEQLVKFFQQGGLTKILDWFKSIPSKLISALISWNTKLIQLGINIVKGIVEGLKQGLTFIIDGVKNVGGAIVDGIKSFFGISSPSKLMEQYGLWITEGLMNGVSKGFDSKKFKEGMKKFLDAAKEELAKAKEAFNTFKNEVYSIIVDSLDFGKAIEESQKAKEAAAEGGTTVGTSFLDALQAQAEKAIAFAEKVALLIKMGLSKDALSEVLAAGTESGTLIADELIAGGTTAINKTNDLVESTKRAAKKVAKFAADSYFGTGVETARKMVKGFKELIKEGGEGYKELMREMDKLAKKLERTIKLKVKVESSGITGVTTSPSVAPSLAPSVAGNVINITVNGAIDPEGTARQIQNILNRSTLRAGAF